MFETVRYAKYRRSQICLDQFSRIYLHFSRSMSLFCCFPNAKFVAPPLWFTDNGDVVALNRHFDTLCGIDVISAIPNRAVHVHNEVLVSPTRRLVRNRGSGTAIIPRTKIVLQVSTQTRKDSKFLSIMSASTNNTRGL
jgi:hypothetical protein